MDSKVSNRSSQVSSPINSLDIFGLEQSATFTPQFNSKVTSSNSDIFSFAAKSSVIRPYVNPEVKTEMKPEMKPEVKPAGVPKGFDIF